MRLEGVGRNGGPGTGLVRPFPYRVRLGRPQDVPCESQVVVLTEAFNLDEATAWSVVIEAERSGHAAFGVFCKDVAETRTMAAEALAARSGHVMTFVVEPTRPGR